MKLGFSTLAAPERPLRELVELAARARYDGLELRGVDREHLDPSMTGGARAAVRRLLDDAGLAAVGVTSYLRLSEAVADPAGAARTLRAYVDLARDVAAPMVRVFGGEVPQGADRDAIEAQMADLLLSVAGAAQEAGVKICLETHDAFCRGTQVARVLARAAHPAIVALWDMAHPWQFGETPEETLEALWPRIGYLHVKDAFAMPDGSRQLCLLGAGDVPVAEVVRLLKARGFGGYLVVEWVRPWHPELPAAEVAIAQHILKLREYLVGAA